MNAVASKTRSLPQKLVCKDLGRNDQSPVITSKAAYTPVSKRVSSRSEALTGFYCVSMLK
ncbi:acetyltransferase [Lacticaseibacillus paracasei]|uniref:ATP synthase beta chain n=1 Tax=Lacticaseibacillus paracasei subsp. paracasei TaxID=47714 RepID=A0AAP9HHV1_LACPA|nr:acetyltransferase [Lacticaseibacillus paracasei]QGV18457.1 ATP synthase beta chain [Lacticaseibacillus paracasei subsp. paracasei]PCL24575.1 acetyltransferase [Lacticaseibacillus paracasei]PCL35383.1 acetyltransferase [Lacticaseibacillus paracasei]RDV41885.1 acetyltransferase [Lacticaseibacillus paracasei subsp. paracasei]